MEPFGDTFASMARYIFDDDGPAEVPRSFSKDETHSNPPPTSSPVPKQKEPTDLLRRSVQTSDGDQGTVLSDIQMAETVSSPLIHQTREFSEYVQALVPFSHSPGYKPPMPPLKERDVVQRFLSSLRTANLTGGDSKGRMRSPSGEFTEFELSNFSVYLPGQGNFPWLLRGLENLHARISHSSFLFDGILSMGGISCYVEGVPFQVCSIGNYGEEHHEVGSNIWIQSDYNSQSDVYYKLGKPSAEYARFHDGFIWLADFAKHFVDYSHASGGAVAIRNFRKDFSIWILDIHKESPVFQSWYKRHGNEDFRVSVSTYIGFLFKESVGVNEDLISMPIWSELLNRNAVPEQKVKEENTIVTPYVYECFKDLNFGSYLKAIDPSSGTAIRQKSQNENLHLTSSNDLLTSTSQTPGTKSRMQVLIQPKSNKSVEIEARDAAIRAAERKGMLAAIKIGDVLAVTKDTTGNIWKDEVNRYKAVENCWYAYVQQIYVSDANELSFDVIWLYRPSDTICGPKMKYPFPGELFMSDHCNCSKMGDTSIEGSEVLYVAKVQWRGQPSTSNNDLFVRQTYLDGERFVTFTEEHKKCQHERQPQRQPQFSIGKTVLAPGGRTSKYGLEVYEVVNYHIEEAKSMAVLRHLVRRCDIEGKGRPNELVYTDKLVSIDTENIERACLVRFYSEFEVANNAVPAPYCRDGTANAFYLSAYQGLGGKVKPFRPNDFPKSLLQGFDPLEPPERQKLRGLDLYCGGGNFGRGLEEGGAVHNQWAVDMNNNAIHTYRANLDDPTSTKLFNGSVNDALSQALRGNPKSSDLIPLPGDVEFISAGSPCQGFSNKNQNKNNEKGLRNQSLVASVAAYVDFYRPKFGILENVPGMSRKITGRDNDCLAQLICTIVGMGYQLHTCLLDAWSFGSPQSRLRVFVVFAAPGLELPPRPELSHSHPPDTRNRDLGSLANGEGFGGRIVGRTPFKFVSAKEATADLPSVGDGTVCTNPKYPEHVVIKSVSERARDQYAIIPKHPRGMNLDTARYRKEGGITADVVRRLFGDLISKYGNVRETFAVGSKSYGRVDPDNVFPIILTRQQPGDSRNGATIHWDEDRVTTLQETKRGQSYPDNEVLVGLPVERYQILGNSVARSVSLALGLSLREAWLKTNLEGMGLSTATTSHENRQESCLGRELRLPNGLESSSHVSLHSESSTARVSTSKLKGILGPKKAIRSGYMTSRMHLPGTSNSDTSHSNTPLHARQATGNVAEIHTLAERNKLPASAAHAQQHIADSSASADEDSFSDSSFSRYMAGGAKSKGRVVSTPTTLNSDRSNGVSPKRKWDTNGDDLMQSTTEDLESPRKTLRIEVPARPSWMTKQTPIILDQDGQSITSKPRTLSMISRVDSDIKVKTSSSTVLHSRSRLGAAKAPQFNGTPSSAALMPSRMAKHVKPRTIITPCRGVRKLPSKPKIKPSSMAGSIGKDIPRSNSMTQTREPIVIPDSEDDSSSDEAGYQRTRPDPKNVISLLSEDEYENVHTLIQQNTNRGEIRMPATTPHAKSTPDIPSPYSQVPQAFQASSSQSRPPPTFCVRWTTMKMPLFSGPQYHPPHRVQATASALLNPAPSRYVPVDDSAFNAYAAEEYPVPSRYVPVDNSAFNAYTATHQYLGQRQGRIKGNGI